MDGREEWSEGNADAVHLSSEKNIYGIFGSCVHPRARLYLNSIRCNSLSLRIYYGFIIIIVNCYLAPIPLAKMNIYEPADNSFLFRPYFFACSAAATPVELKI